MINIKKKIFFVIKSIFVLVTFLTLVLFFYAAFFYKPSSVEKKTEENKDNPSKSSLDQKMSDVVGKVSYNFSKIGEINYKFSLDHNLNDLNYNEVSTSLNFGMIGFNLDYLEEQNHVGNENYVRTGISLNLNDNNQLSFETKKNFKTESTELYNLSYQYINDCLTAGLVYRREFYEDNDVEQKDTLMFKITFLPFGAVKTPSFINPWLILIKYFSLL